jgi:succinylglutamate desuccinylase
LNRLIGRYSEGNKGPLLIVIGGMHGNEPAGIHAVESLVQMLEQEKEKNPGFDFKGAFVGLRGNLQAIEQGKRFNERDLNRSWVNKKIIDIESQVYGDLIFEDKEIADLLAAIRAAIERFDAREVCVLDIHTTTASGGIFSIPNGSEKSLKLAKSMHAPVVLGMLDGIKGTSLHYFNNQYWDLDMTSIVFEAGQHIEALSENRAISAMVSCLRELGCVHPTDVESHHDKILKQYAEGLPEVTRLLYAHSIGQDDDFVMQPGFLNFQAIDSGTLLARDSNGPIHADRSGLMLMPLYQAQGEDGFFLIEEVTG